MYGMRYDGMMWSSAIIWGFYLNIQNQCVAGNVIQLNKKIGPKDLCSLALKKLFTGRSRIELLPLILTISWNEIQLWRFERNRSWCWWDMKENVRFWSKYRVVTPYFDCLRKWNPVMKVWQKSELMLMRYEGKC